MSFSAEWDELYRAGTHLSVWPWSDLVSYVYRYARAGRGYDRVLELGCGAGANIPLFLKLGADYSALEGSPTIVQSVLETYPMLQGKIIATDFTRDIPFTGPFDLVFDRASLIHNPTTAIANALNLVFDRLRPGGKFIGVDWFSDQHSSVRLGREVDAHTRADLPPGGAFAGTGNVHFCDKAHLIGLLEGAGFRVERLEHKRYDPAIPEGEETIAVWNFVAAKP
ncbi:MAG: hypothetical protein JWR51_40 [Devosia sp.]|uniref:class I SAM-dependent methyltransferase n=1 Tax=Devosia sp. TaxID=1871048 RepID=UPI00262DB94E|nr:class I SAM-dependent methyltransferase [Devosia sp.]MDB5526937.1 hypothetical protein [Devosia sp.]